MGNFSRNTYDATKNYISVRLQQGVPLVDADWNELSDVTLQEVYRATEMLGSGVIGGNNDWLVVPTGVANSFLVIPGTILAGGRPVRLSSTLAYLSQPYANAAKAAAVGIPVVPPLTTPTANRDDLAYLDTWEREVLSSEDSNIVNSAIGIETAVRTKRDFAVRVAEGSILPPAPALGHTHVPLAILHRLAGVTAIAPGQPQDVRPVLASSSGDRYVSLFPAFQPVWFGVPVATWQTLWPSSLKSLAYKPVTQATAAGLLPLFLPHGCTMRHLQVKGTTAASIQFQLVRAETRSVTGSGGFDVILDQTIPQSASSIDYNNTYGISASSDRKEVVDNINYMYYLFTLSFGTNLEARISGMSMRITT